MNNDMRYFEAEIGGSALLMHNGQLADPLNPFAKTLKALTSKKKKSDEDHLNIAEAEFRGGLYYDEKLGPYIPGEVIDSTLKNGAKKKKLGTIFEACVSVPDLLGYPLLYKGPRTPEALWKENFWDRRGAGVNQSRVIRTRPRFNDWKLKFEIQVFPCELNPSDIQQAIIDAGVYVGLCDHRPRFGLFQLHSFKELHQAAAAE